MNEDDGDRTKMSAAKRQEVIKCLIFATRKLLHKKDALSLLLLLLLIIVYCNSET